MYRVESATGLTTKTDLLDWNVELSQHWTTNERS